MDEQTHLLIKQAKTGDQEALVRLIVLFKDEYYRLAFSYTGNKEDALDAVEDMTIIIFEKMRKLKKEEAFLSWSRTILVNCCKKLIRKRKKVVMVESFHEPIFEEDFATRDHKLDFEKLFKKISKEQAEAIKLRYLLDYDIRTIAAVLAVPEGTVKSRISIGLKKLKESLGGDRHE